MMNPNEFAARQTQLDDMRRFADAHNEGQAIVDDQAEKSPAYAATLAKIGEQLVKVGEDLQTRYGDSPSQQAL